MNQHLLTILFDFHSLMIYTEIVEYNIVGDTKAPLHRRFPFISNLKSGDVKTTGRYMNDQTLSNLQFRRLLKNSFQSVHFYLRDFYFTLPDAASINPDIVVNSHAKGNKRGTWIPFKI